jgi:hypothetical protein
LFGVYYSAINAKSPSPIDAPVAAEQVVGMGIEGEHLENPTTSSQNENEGSSTKETQI